ncbi:2-amino-4-hydroxy-6-hydroxymethyldihydropteridine diphosphokinase [Staphylococcus argensis]|uniref:2-amino-4-hydroxy-6-hydroxymethyldihydropteridine diphosphokinase n=1 Tax=Staphylococcus argensis TaxID=1607738 RepID=A0A2K4FBG2_9STAP|nr:2-amino-4-hydroxy-6-hydroxymethyldihydropteridine diphosphokinase [Staphylococcus argensis]MCY6992102.1 2-amino-4-hydroxy-6-hydroxymethyldihydropteridine diphosphokinase [Staphylococcus argensis]POA08708.1 2-amino-4-hydroxy-6-hydroxymethyldihydropteridine diphosphokinase [Staphylococcus argensis]
MTKAYLSLGSNMGDRAYHLREALRLLNQVEGIEVRDVSPIYDTAPIGYTDQNAFLNLCASVETTLSAHDLLYHCLDVEQQLHRVRKIHWGPRTCDIDIILYGEEQIQDDELTVPHPRMEERAFVLVPLQDIAPDAIEPKTQRRVGDIPVPDDRVQRTDS